eukprot:XP_001707181.1 Hypothetical protein GL50803_16607 [Giardia lamblia ATCC 50803]
MSKRSVLIILCYEQIEELKLMNAVPRELRSPVTEAMLLHKIISKKRFSFLYSDSYETEIEFRLGVFEDFLKQRLRPHNQRLVSEALVHRIVRMQDYDIMEVAARREPRNPISDPKQLPENKIYQRFNGNIGEETYLRLMKALVAAHVAGDSSSFLGAKILGIETKQFRQDLYDYKVGDVVTGNYRVRTDVLTGKLLEEGCKIQFDVSNIHFPHTYMFDVRFAIAKEFSIAAEKKNEIKESSKPNTSIRKRTSFRTEDFVIDLTYVERYNTVGVLEEKLYQAELEVLPKTFGSESSKPPGRIFDELLANVKALIACASGLTTLYPLPDNWKEIIDQSNAHLSSSV